MLLSSNRYNRQKALRHLRPVRDLADASLGVKEQDRDGLERKLSQVQPSLRRMSVPLPDSAWPSRLSSHFRRERTSRFEWFPCSIYSTFVFLKKGNLRKLS